MGPQIAHPYDLGMCGVTLLNTDVTDTDVTDTDVTVTPITQCTLITETLKSPTPTPLEHR